MESKHARLYKFQLTWYEEDAPESFNLSGYVRETLDAVIPAEALPQSRLPKSDSVNPDRWSGQEQEAERPTSRFHVSLYSYQKEWVEDQSSFQFSRYVRHRLTERVSDTYIPENWNEQPLLSKTENPSQ